MRHGFEDPSTLPPWQYCRASQNIPGSLREAVLAGGEQGLKKAQSFRKRRSRLENPGVSGNADKFMNAWPGNRPSAGLMAQPFDQFSGLDMEITVFAV